MENGSEPVAELRRRVLDELGEDGIHRKDLDRIKTDDQWLERFYRHQEHHMELALGMLVECLKWRIEYGVNELTPASFPRSFFEAGSLYSYTQDRQEFRILMFHVKLHQKESESLTEFKRFLVYWLEQIEAEHTRRVTVIFDMTDTGIANMDMEFLKFFISLFKFYYPSFLAHFLVFELPWILNTAWKLVKTWLSPKAVDKIKFVNRESILEYIAPENLPAHMGGSSTFQYVPPSGMQDEGPSRSVSSSSTTKKKVHFAEEDTPSKLEDSTKSDSDVSLNNGITPGKEMNLQGDCRLEDGSGRILRITPPEDLVFVGQPEQESAGILNLFNNKTYCIAFKVKTTSPEKYRVRPSSGVIKPGCQCDVVVHLQAGYQSTSLARDKFLVMAMELEEDPGSPQELNELWRCAPKERIMERKLKCVLHHPPPAPCLNSTVCRSSGDAGRMNMCVPNCSKLQCVDENHALMVEICHELRYLRRLMFAILFLLLALAVFLFIASTMELPPLKGPKSYYFDGCASGSST